MSMPGDPAPESGSGNEPADIRPVIPTGGGGNMGFYVFLAILAAGGGTLFSALNASREVAQAPAVLQTGAGNAERIASPPPLEIPERFAGAPGGGQPAPHG